MSITTTDPDGGASSVAAAPEPALSVSSMPITPSEEPAKALRPDGGTTHAATVRDLSDFSVILGGPLYQLYLRTRIVRPPLGLLGRRILVISMVTWFPLLLLSLASARAWGGARVPFLFDIEAHVRFLAALPLLIFAEVLVHQRIRPILFEFVERGIVTPEHEAAFDRIVLSAKRWRNSVWAEVVLLLLVTTVGQMVWRSHIAMQSATWYAEPTASGFHLTMPGLYYAFVSMTIFRFILFRWYYRLVLWFVFLWRVSRLPLRLVPTHPDRAGGLEFLQGSAYAITPVLVAQSLLMAGLFANRIFFEGAKLTMFRLEILGMLLLFMLLALGPLLVFAPRIMACRRLGLIEYGKFGSEYTRAFERKWIHGQHDTAESPLGSGDIQSLADLGNSYEIIRGMNGLPFGRQAVVRLGVAALLPFAPLVLTMIPLEQLVDRVFKSLF